MKKTMYDLGKMCLTLFFLAVFGSTADATVFTAVLSGNFNAAATWGVVTPPAGVLSSDVIIIPPGITVTLTSAETFSGTSTLTVNGALNAASSAAPLILTSGTLSGSGMISVDSMMLGLTSGLTFTGSIATRALMSTGANISSATSFTVNKLLNITSGNLSLTAGSITMGTGSLIRLSGGTITTSGTGVLNVPGTYNVLYSAATTTGIELAGATLDSITVNTAGTVTLAANQTINGVLTLSSGALALNGHTLTLGALSNVAASGTGTISGSATSNLIVNATNTLSGAIRFTTGSNIVNNLTINSASSSITSLGSDLTVGGIMTLASGSLGLNGHTLTLGSTGDLAASGTGTIMGSATSNLIINTTGSLTGMLHFATGSNTVGNLTVNSASSSVASLGSDLIVNGMMTLTSGSLALNGYTLTLGAAGNMAASGTGAIMGSSTSNLVINTAGSLTGALRFAAGSNILNRLTLNTGASSVASLGSDLTVGGVMSLTSGSLALAGHTLTLNSTSDLASGAGTLTGSATSNVVINTAGGLTGALSFATGGNTLHNLTMNMSAASDVVSLGSSLNIVGTLTMTMGRLSLNANNLVIAAGGAVTGATSNSYVVADGAGSLVMNLASSATDNFPVGSMFNYTPMTIIANASSTAGDVSIHVANAVYANGYSGTMLSATGNVVSNTWFVSSTASTINYNMMAMWNAGMEVNGFVRGSSYISHYTGGAWDVQPLSAATFNGGMYSSTRIGITSLSPFMVSGDRSTTSVPTTAVNIPIIIYPNPASDKLSFTDNGSIERISVMDMSGTVLYTIKTADHATVLTDHMISIQDLPTGDYFINFSGWNFSDTQRFIKQ